MANTGALELVGQVVDGKYRVDEPLGRGGMGAVFRATHLGTDRTVALKVIQPALASDPAYLERFRREARACGRLRHQNIVDVTDFGVCHQGGGPLAYLVMEFLDGCTLADVLEAEPIPPLAWTIDILEQVCAAVEEAHRQGILHRDLKPDNVWLEPNRRGGYSVKVLDFGLAKLDAGETVAPAAAIASGPAVADAREAGPTVVAEPSPGATFAPSPAATFAASPDATFAALPGGTFAAPAAATLTPLRYEPARTTIAGTPGYMSPEQASAGAVTARTDVYSLGVIAFRMLAGREPFTGPASEVMRAHVHTAPPPIRELAPLLSADAADLVMAALSKDPAARPASAGRFGNMLAGRLEPPGASWRKALTLILERPQVFLTLGTACFLPALAGSVVLAGWTAASTAGLVPGPTGRMWALPNAILGFVAITGAFATGVMPVVVLHALAAPQRPIDLAALFRVYETRVRAWLRAMAPIIGPQLLALVVVAVSIGALMALRPWIRPLDPRVRLVVVLAMLLPGMIMQWWAILRLGARLQGASFLGSVMLVEGLGFEAARARAVALAANAGRLQRRGRSRLLIVTILLSVLVSFSATRLRITALEVAVLAPLLMVAATMVQVLLSVLTSLGYFNARRAMGESMDQALEDFERAVLPATHWQRSHRDQVMTQITRGSSAAVTRPEVKL